MLTDNGLTRGGFALDCRRELRTVECLDCRTAHIDICRLRSMEYNRPISILSVRFSTYKRHTYNRIFLPPEPYSLTLRIRAHRSFRTHAQKPQALVNPGASAADEIFHIPLRRPLRHTQLDVSALGGDAKVEILDVFVANHRPQAIHRNLLLPQKAYLPPHLPARIARIFCATL